MNKLIGCACMLAVCAYAGATTIHVQDNFQDGELTSNPTWTELTAGHLVSVDPDNGSNYVLDSTSYSARSSTPSAGTIENLVTIEYVVDAVNHWCEVGIALVNEDGDGFAFVADSSSPTTGYVSMVLMYTEDDAASFLPSSWPFLSAEDVYVDNCFDRHTVKWEWDRTTGQIDAYMDGSGVYTYTDSGGLSAGFKDFTKAIAFGQGLYIDDLVISSIPEPVSFALLGIGGLALIRRRK